MSGSLIGRLWLESSSVNLECSSNRSGVPTSFRKYLSRWMDTRKGVRSRFWFFICQSSTLVVCAIHAAQNLALLITRSSGIVASLTWMQNVTVKLNAAHHLICQLMPWRISDPLVSFPRSTSMENFITTYYQSSTVLRCPQNSQWARELLRDRDRLLGHMEWFEREGRYSSVIESGEIEDYIVLDFAISRPGIGVLEKKHPVNYERSFCMRLRYIISSSKLRDLQSLISFSWKRYWAYATPGGKGDRMGH